jgi:hypothetical protein
MVRSSELALRIWAPTSRHLKTLNRRTAHSAPRTTALRSVQRAASLYHHAMNRLESIRREVDSILLRLVSDEDRRCGFVHLYGVSLTATWLAERRGLHSE